MHTYLTYTYHTVAVNSESEKIRMPTEDNFRERIIDVLAVLRREELWQDTQKEFDGDVKL